MRFSIILNDVCIGIYWLTKLLIDTVEYHCGVAKGDRLVTDNQPSNVNQKLYNNLPLIHNFFDCFSLINSDEKIL